jgi:hypothetical protein
MMTDLVSSVSAWVWTANSDSSRSRRETERLTAKTLSENERDLAFRLINGILGN